MRRLLRCETSSGLKNLDCTEDTDFESVDFTRSRVGRGCAVIRTFMAHHIGMSIIAAANFLLDNIFVKYFMSDPRMGAADSLLCEKIPVDAVIHKTVPYRKEMPTRTHALPTAESFREDNKAVPRTAVGIKRRNKNCRDCGR